MFLGWYDADKKYPTVRKVTDALGRYQDKYGEAAHTCLMSVEDAEALRNEPDLRKLKLTIVGATYVPRHTFYVGAEDIVVDESPSESVIIPAAA